MKWVSSFLNKRSATLTLNNCEHTAIVERGCPQGSVISTFLWNLIVDEALRLSFPYRVRIQAFEHDLIITKTGMNEISIQINLQHSINKLVAWGKRNHLKFSGEKTELITFTRKHRTLDHLSLRVDDVRILPKKQTKYLGVTMDQKLNWRTHIENKYTMCKRKFWN